MPIIVCPNCGCDVNSEMFCNQCGWSPNKAKPYDDGESQSPKTLEDVIELATLRAKVASLEAENAKMREALVNIQELSYLSFISKSPLAEYMEKVNHIAKNALSSSTDESEEK